MANLYIDNMSFHSKPQACVASAFPTGSSPKPHPNILTKKLNVSQSVSKHFSMQKFCFSGFIYNTILYNSKKKTINRYSKRQKLSLSNKM